MLPLPEHDRRALLDLARRAIVEAVNHQPLPEVLAGSGALGQPSGVFVSLHLRGRLRGCIGHVQPLEPLAVAVMHCGRAAALEDRRFHPVRPEEVADLEIEISVLSPLVPVLPDQIEIGKHGLVVTRGGLRGLLLPQVATQYRWTPPRFLEETCTKAGLERDAWKDPATRVEAFTADVFSEAELHQRQAQAS